ncbi:MAG TPA: PAS domain S-box protein [Polyangia bacterium]
MTDEKEPTYGELLARVAHLEKQLDLQRATGLSAGGHSRSADETLHAVQATLNAIVESTADLIWAVDAEHFRLLMFNQGLRDYFSRERGLSIEQGQGIEDLFPTEDSVRRWREYYGRALREGPYTTEYVVYAGTRTLELCFNLMRRDGPPFGISVFARDVTERKAAEEALRKSEQNFRQITEESPVAIYIIQEGKLVYVNPSLAKQAGYDREEMVGKLSPQDLIHRNDVARLMTTLGERAAGRIQGQAVEYRGIRKDGSILHFAAYGLLIEYQGKPAVMGTLIDISERHRLEHALSGSATPPPPQDSGLHEHQFRTVFETSCSMMWLMDLQGHVLKMNTLAVTFAGTTSQQTVGSLLWETACWNHSPQIQAFVREAVSQAAAGQSVRHQTVHPQDGRPPIVVELIVQPVLRPDGQVVQLLGEGRDVSQLISADLALAETAQKFRTVVQNAPAIIFILDRHGVFQLSEGQALSQLGLQPGQVVGNSAFELYKDTPSIVEGIRKALAGETARVQNTLGTVTFDTIYSPYWNAEGERDGVVGIAVDTTPLLVANDERQRLQSLLLQAQRMEAIGQLAGGVEHDFNNILAAMLMYLGQLQMDEDLTPGMRSSLKALDECANRAATLTRQLLAFSRREAVRRRQLDLDSLLGNLLRMLRRIVGENVSLEFPGAKLPLWIFADPGMIEQVFANLVVNARDAMPHGGRIQIKIESRVLSDRDTLAAADARPGTYAVLSVTDSGCGMDALTMGRVFEPFFTTKGEGKGTGLGLAVVYGIVKRHEGWIEVDSTVDIGTTFRVFLPQLLNVTVASEEDLAPASLPRGKEMILLVEDDYVLRDVVAGVLARAGYQVLQAATGQQAIDAWAKQGGRVDLLLTDLIMPEGMTGIELSQRLRRERPNLKVVIMSGHDLDNGLEAMPAQEKILYLQKPFATTTLANTIRRCLDS